MQQIERSLRLTIRHQEDDCEAYFAEHLRLRDGCRAKIVDKHVPGSQTLGEFIDINNEDETPSVRTVSRRTPEWKDRYTHPVLDTSGCTSRHCPYRIIKNTVLTDVDYEML